jgi:hypothetical protein
MGDRWLVEAGSLKIRIKVQSSYKGLTSSKLFTG